MTPFRRGGGDEGSLRQLETNITARSSSLRCRSTSPAGKFDSILCLARGGLRVGDVISRIYDMPLAILAASSYREAAAARGRAQLDIARIHHR